mgnify:CR=1 FL=1
MGKNLVIVESPAKAKTIEKFLGPDFEVLSSYGHIRDLKTKDISIDFKKQYEPIYEIPADKKKLVADLKKKVKERHIKEPVECRQILIDSIKEQMHVEETAYEFEKRQSVVLVVGVNGVGKTTSIGKMAMHYKNQGKKVVLAAADTFRAAAIEQLTEWANRAKVDIIAQKEGSDPGAVVFDAR